MTLDCLGLLVQSAMNVDVPGNAEIRVVTNWRGQPKEMYLVMPE